MPVFLCPRRVSAACVVTSAATAASALASNALGGDRAPSSRAQQHVVEQATADGVRAVFSYYVGANGGYSDLRVSIYRSGHLALTSLLPFRDYDPLGHVLFAKPEQSIRVARLTPGGEPTVIVDLYTGGTHCCADSLLYVYTPNSRSYRRVNHLWGNAFYQLRDLSGDGSLEFLSADADRFAYTFASFGSSFFPVQVWQLEGTALPTQPVHTGS